MDGMGHDATWLPHLKRSPTCAATFGPLFFLFFVSGRATVCTKSSTQQSHDRRRAKHGGWHDEWDRNLYVETSGEWRWKFKATKLEMRNFFENMKSISLKMRRIQAHESHIVNAWYGCNPQFLPSSILTRSHEGTNTSWTPGRISEGRDPAKQLEWWTCISMFLNLLQ